MERRTGVFGADRAMIDDFKASWPCHGLPDNLNCVVAAFDSKGDLVELDGFDENGESLDTHDYDGPALLALVEDIQSIGFDARPHDGAAYVAAISNGEDF